MSETKSYFAFHKNVFTHNYYNHDNCDINDYIDEITEDQFKAFKKENYGYIEVFDSKDDCRKYAEDLKNSFVNKEKDIKQLFLDHFSKEFCDYLFSQNIQLRNSDFEYYRDNLNNFDYLFKTEFFLKEDFDFNVSKCKLKIIPMFVYNNCNKIFDIDNNKVMSINLKVEINE